jgi:hypothetical protein
MTNPTDNNDRDAKIMDALRSSRAYAEALMDLIGDDLGTPVPSWMRESTTNVTPEDTFDVLAEDEKQ